MISLPDRKQPDFDFVSGKPDFAGPEPGVSMVNFLSAGLSRKFSLFAMSI
jgi:hypothetical protein